MTISDLRAAGYTVEAAFGDAVPEQAHLDALLSVQAAAPPLGEVELIVDRLRAAFTASRDDVTKERFGTALMAANTVRELDAAVIAAQAAVAAATVMPTVYHVTRAGISMYVRDDDLDTITALISAPVGVTVNTGAV